ncbi:hypothetical protein ACFL5O_00525 [Myxococcota bacterium]
MRSLLGRATLAMMGAVSLVACGDSDDTVKGDGSSSEGGKLSVTVGQGGATGVPPSGVAGYSLSGQQNTAGYSVPGAQGPGGPAASQLTAGGPPGLLGTAGLSTAGTSPVAGTGNLAQAGGTGQSAAAANWTVQDGGYYTTGDWHGYAWNAAQPQTGDAVSTIEPASFETHTAGSPFCVAGIVAPMSDYSGTAMVGLNLSQEEGADGGEQEIATSGDGIVVNVTRNVTSTVRVQIQSLDGGTNADHRWCSTLKQFDENVLIPWSDFNTECWPGGKGVDYAQEPISAALILIPGDDTKEVPYDLCLNYLGPSAGGGTPAPTTGAGGGTAAPTGAAGGTATGTAGGSAVAGATGTAGGSAVGAGGEEGVECSNTDLSILPINDTGWVDRTCNEHEIQGAFYWYAADNIKTEMQCGGATCEESAAPWSETSSGMCISGTATGESEDWGAGIGISLNESGGDDSVKAAYNAADHNIIGFDVTIVGNTNGMPIRVGLTGEDQQADASLPSPFLTMGAVDGTLNLSGSSELVIAKAAVPDDWEVDNAGATVDASAIYDLQFQVAADSADAGTTFDICITDLKPVLEGETPATTGSCSDMTTSGGALCDNLDIASLGDYGVQANVNNGSGLCVQPTKGGDCVGFTTEVSGSLVSPSDAPAAYPSLIYGWHWGKWFGGYTQANAKQVSEITSIPSSFAFTEPTGSKWNAAYDMWLASSSDISGEPNGGLEVMIWQDRSAGNSVSAIGSQVDTMTIADVQWEVWVGTTGATWDVVSFRRSTPSSAAIDNMDLLPFIQEGLARANKSTDWYLLSIQAGFELFDVTAGGSVTNFSASVN